MFYVIRSHSISYYFFFSYTFSVNMNILTPDEDTDALNNEDSIFIDALGCPTNYYGSNCSVFCEENIHPPHKIFFSFVNLSSLMLLKHHMPGTGDLYL